MSLTDVSIRQCRPTDRPQKLFDGDGLYLIVMPGGSRLWRFKYQFQGREKLLSFGKYPDVPLKLARDRRDEARRLLAAGGDPSAKRKAERTALGNTFEAIAREWLEMQSKSLDPRTFQKKRERFENFVFPYLGKLPITTIKAVDVLAVLKRIEARGKHVLAKHMNLTEAEGPLVCLLGRVFLAMADRFFYETFVMRLPELTDLATPDRAARLLAALWYRMAFVTNPPKFVLTSIPALSALKTR